MKALRAGNSRLLVALYERAATAGLNSGRDAKENGSIRRVARAGIAAFFVYCTGIGLTYCSQLVIARTVGADIYGVYTYVFSWMVVLSYAAILGLDVALLKFLPAYQAEGAWSLARGMIKYAHQRVAAAGVVLICVGVSILLASGAPPGLRSSFLVGFLLVPLLALVRIRCSVIRVFGGVVSALVPDRVVRDGMLIIFLVIGSLGFGWTVNATSLMAVAVVSSVVALGLTQLTLRRRRPKPLNTCAPMSDAPMWRRSAFPLVIIGATEVLMNRTGVLLLGWTGDTTSAGIYGLVFNIALVATLPRVAVNTLFAPEISSLHARNDKAMIQILVTRAASWSFGGGFCIALLLYLLAHPLLAWFGPEFEAGVPALRVLLICQVITASAGSQLYVMTMTGHERIAALLLIASAATNAGAGAVLIQLMGLTGAALGTTVAFIGWNIVMSLFLWRRLKLFPGVLAIFCLPVKGENP